MEGEKVTPKEAAMTKDDYNYLMDLYERRSNYDVIGVLDREHEALRKALLILRETLLHKEKPHDG